MDLFQLEAFVAIVREGSFSKAAKALFRTQPAVSQIIQRLEGRDRAVAVRPLQPSVAC